MGLCLLPVCNSHPVISCILYYCKMISWLREDTWHSVRVKIYIFWHLPFFHFCSSILMQFSPFSFPHSLDLGLQSVWILSLWNSLDGELAGGFNPPLRMLTGHSSSIVSMCNNRDRKMKDNITYKDNKSIICRSMVTVDTTDSGQSSSIMKTSVLLLLLLFLTNFLHYIHEWEFPLEGVNHDIC